MSHYKSYPEYKYSGVEWLGQVPEHWEVSPMKWAIARNDGGVWGDDPSGESDTLVLRSTEQTVDGNWRIEEPAYRALSAADKEFALLKAGDLLVTKSSGSALHIGKTTLVTPEIEEMQCCYSNFMQRIRTTDDIRPKLAWYLMNNGLVREQFDYLSNTTTGLANLNGTMIGSVHIAIPPDEEQKAILAALDRETARIDALVEKKTRFIELLCEKRQALITHAVTKGLDPNVKMKDSGVEWLGEVPEHWTVRRLKFIARVQTGVAKGKDVSGKETVEVQYLRVANVQDGYLDLDEIATIQIDKEDLERYLLQPGDVLMNEGGDFDKLGRGHIWSGELSPCIHQNHVFAVRPHGVSSAWLNAFTSSTAAQFYFMGKSKQSTNLASISSSNLMELSVTVPPDEEQRRVLAQMKLGVEKLDKLIGRTERSVELLKERRSALITAAVTGQIDLREAV
ncbi:type I restriction-modification methylase S subunit [Herbaspirillum hiltneri N3]|uniref:Type I restriction-modification methylase S subunit n=1 Tax=Herbaspirillum hiltneri N3 TaxID=1262470 RepID=A0ABN4HT35_9BURK|nr:restriction endonuclease subunit S [Herbaspirillum hiltneri]AKZ61704.1 type I restriction-modification methylase S subunit [Herbaspirillum hiltneri N3]